MKEISNEIKEKVILIPSTSTLVGVSVYVLNLSRILMNIGLLDVVICPGSGWLSDQLKSENIPFEILEISYKFPFFIYSSFILLHFLQKRKSAKIIHLNGRFPTLISIPSMIFLPQKHFVVTVHEFSNTRRTGLSSLKTYLESLVWRYGCDKISCVSESLMREVIARLGEKNAYKVKLIKNWIYPYNYASSNVIKGETLHLKKEIRIITVGRLAYEKGFDIVISAIDILVRSGYQIACDIYGDGPEKEKLTEQISKFNLTGKVKIKGTHSNVRLLFPNYDIIIIPSRKESFGIVALEAYDAGVPVIASNIPGLRETVLQDETGLLFEPENPQSLSFQILRLICSPELISKLIQNGKKYVKNFYPDEDLCRQYLNFYSLTDFKE